MNGDNTLRKAIGNLINLRRRALGISLTDFGLVLEIPVDELVKLEKGTLNYGYRISVYQKISDVLNLQPLMKLVGISVIDNIVEAADKFNKSLDVVKPLSETEHSSLNEFKEVLRDMY